MSDSKPIHVVPVDPRAYGLGVLIGCLLRFWPAILVVLAILGGIGLVAIVSGGIREATHQSWVSQVASQIETMSLKGQYDSEGRTFLVEYQLVYHGQDSTRVNTGVQLPVRWYDCDDGNDHTWTYGGSTTEGVPANTWLTLYPGSVEQGTIVLDQWHGSSVAYYVGHCKYEIGEPQFQVLDAQQP